MNDPRYCVATSMAQVVATTHLVLATLVFLAFVNLAYAFFLFPIICI
jgi:hypothetical protein